VETTPDRNVVILSEAFWKEIQAHPMLVNIPGASICTCSSAGAAIKRGEPSQFHSSVLSVFRKRLNEWLRLVHLY
jgi:hypothetical protein